MDAIYNIISSIMRTLYDISSYISSNTIAWILAFAGIIIISRTLIYPIYLSGQKTSSRMRDYTDKLNMIKERTQDNDIINTATESTKKEMSVSMSGLMLPILIQLFIIVSIYQIIKGFTTEGSNYSFNEQYVQLFREAHIMGTGFLETVFTTNNILAPLIIMTLSGIITWWNAKLSLRWTRNRRKEEATKAAKFIEFFVQWISPISMMILVFILPLGMSVYLLLGSIWTINQGIISRNHIEKWENKRKSMRKPSRAPQIGNTEPGE